MTVLRNSKNGGVTMVIRPDGTKIRWGSNPELPESIDLKITDYCDAGCKFCHESSTKKGIHGNSGWIYNLIGQCIRGSELAIGGGNPLDHPDLEKILVAAKSRGVYSNLTVNHKHVGNHLINFLMYRGLVCGLGVSLGESFRQLPEDMLKLYIRYGSRIVFHMIAGIHNEYDLETLFRYVENPKILILGYKEYGFGKKKDRRVDHNIERIEESIHNYRGKHISFDNLALKQLNIKDKFKKEYENGYMGADGTHTMYIDAVAQQFAIGSTGQRIDCMNKSLKDMFEDVKTLPGISAEIP